MNAASPPPAEAVLLNSLFERQPWVLWINLGVAAGTVLAFGPFYRPELLLSWYLAMVASAVLRIRLRQSFMAERPQHGRWRRWIRRYTIGAASTGLVWGGAGVLFYQPDLAVAQIFLPFVVAGMSGGALVVLTGCMSAFVAFCVSLLAPYGLRLLWEGDLLHVTMAGLTAFFMLGIGLLGRSVNASLKASVELAAEKERLLAALQEKSGALEATFQHINQGVAVFDPRGRLTTWNRRHQELHGYPFELYRPGTPHEAFRRFDRDMALMHRQPEPAPEAGASEPEPEPPTRFEQPGAANRILEVERSPMPGGAFVSTSTDITERKRVEASILHLAQHDPLTDLPNRLLLGDRLAQAMSRAKRQRGLVAVMLLDLDRFKAINDQFGHRLGDRVLIELADRLRGSVREADTVARIGGDEFALLLPDLADAEAATLVANKLVGRLQQVLTLDGHALTVRVSLGVALYPRDGLDAATLMQHADIAMYRAKAAGGGVRRFMAQMLAGQARAPAAGLAEAARPHARTAQREPPA